MMNNKRKHFISGDSKGVLRKNDALYCPPLEARAFAWERTAPHTDIIPQKPQSKKDVLSAEAKEKLFDASTRGIPPEQLKLVKSLTAQDARDLLQSKVEFDPPVKSALMAQSLRE